MDVNRAGPNDRTYVVSSIVMLYDGGILCGTIFHVLFIDLPEILSRVGINIVVGFVPKAGFC